MRTAIIGCGKAAHLHAAALVAHSTLAGVCDRDEERASAFAARYQTQGFTEAGAMFRRARPQAVCICTPHPLHARFALAAAEHGVHMLVEKPLAADLAECDAIIAAARRGRVQLGVVSQRRWFEPVLRMKAAIEAGKIGRPILGSVVMLSWRDEAYYASDPWRGRWDTEGGGVLVNQAPHHLDILRWLMGPIAEVSGYWANLNHPKIEVEDSAVASIRFANGALGSILVSLCQNPGIYTKIHVHGSNGASVGVQTDGGATFIAGVTGISDPPYNDLWTVPGEEHLLEKWQEQDRARFRMIDPVQEYHTRQIQEFLEAIAEGRPPAVTGEDGRNVVELFAAIYQSNRNRHAISFPLTMSAEGHANGRKADS